MSNDWSSRWTAAIGARIRDARLRQGLSTQDLAERTAELGYPMARSSVGNFETRPRAKIYVQDVAILAAALGVPPVELLYPSDVVVFWSGGSRLDDDLAYATLRKAQVEMLPGDHVAAHRAAGWFSGGYGMRLELRIAAMSAAANFTKRARLLATLEAEDATGELRERAEAAGAPTPDEFLPVLRMEVYDLAVAADRLCRLHDDVAEKARDGQPAVSDEEREAVAAAAAEEPDPYIADPAQRPDVNNVFGIGGPQLPPLPETRPHVLGDQERERPTSYYRPEAYA